MICLHTDKNCPYVNREDISMTKKCTECENYGQNQKRSLHRSRVARLLFFSILVLVTGVLLVIVLTEGKGFWIFVLTVSFTVLINKTITQFEKLQNRDYYVR